MALPCASRSHTFLVACMRCQKVALSAALEKLPLTRTHTGRLAPPSASSHKVVKVWWPSVRYSWPSGPTTTVFSPAAAMGPDSGTVQAKPVPATSET